MLTHFHILWLNVAVVLSWNALYWKGLNTVSNFLDIQLFIYLHEKTLQHILSTRSEPLSRVSTGRWSETIRPLSVCLTVVSSTLLLYAVLSLPWHGWPHVHTWDKLRGFNNVSEMPLYNPDTLVAPCQAAVGPHVHPTTNCVGTSWVDLLDVKIRHLPFKKVCSTHTHGLH